ncbi:Protein kinase alk2 [Orbilia ellipsospora]|uniref:Protein kinase alk2 n=1 Tax=Orbilia ellipsospora TaxID=2528407 RepID=A0AAV9XKJ8_9PEZI
MQVKRQNLLEEYRENFEEYGHTYASSVLGDTTIVTREPLNIQAVLATQFKDFGLGPRKHKPFSPLLGDGIFTVDGPGWEVSRALLRPQFARSQITQLENLEEHLQTMMECIPNGEGLTWRNRSCNSLKHRLSALRNGENDEETLGPRFTKYFNAAQDHLVTRFFLRDLANLHNPKDFKEAIQFIHNFVDRYVQKALDIQSQSDRKPNSEKPTTEKYVFLEAIAQETQDPVILRDALLNILLAGRDTTASLLGWVFYLLVRHPSVEQKLRATIQEHFGKEGEKPITFESLKNCKYLVWVINETMRMYPTVPINSRVAVVDTVLPLGGGPDQRSPVFVPKGTSVEYMIYAMHRREDIWGPDANWFRPERWGEKRNSKEFNNFEFLPFNAGPRICLGQQFALTEASYTIVRIFQRFKRFENAELNQFVKCNQTLTMAVGGKGVLVRCYGE